MPVSEIEQLKREKEDLERRVDVLQQELKRLRSLQKLLSETVEKMTLVSRISQELNRLDTQEIRRIVTDRIPGLLHARLASLYLYDSVEESLTLFASNHPYPIEERVFVREAEETVMVQSLRKRSIQVFEDLSQVGSEWGRAYSDRYQTESCICVPLLAGEEIVGVFNLADREGGCFDQMNDLVIIEPLATVLGIAIHNGQLHEEAQRQARHDPMTGLLNHSSFFSEFEREVFGALSSEAPLSLVMVDIDDFKHFNDTYGHQAGDRVILGVSREIQESIRTTDKAARYGGDEFAIILPGSPIQGGELTAQRILNGLRDHDFDLESGAPEVGLSLGVTSFRSGESSAQFLERADEALYEAKRKGKNQIVIVPTPGS
ncbi:MAG: diguanylate cyclase [Planctomycetota bacterium]|nr:diguanylate cyclase [Planctomycetota bacterium]